MINMTISKIIGSIIEIIILSLIPFIWWVISARKKEAFFHWLGFRKIEKNSIRNTFNGILLILLFFIVVSALSLFMLKDIETATSEFAGLGIKGLLPAFIYAIFNTSLPEEIFFRGFLMKRISAKTGYQTANIIQSIIFGLMHGIMFFTLVSIWKAFLITLLTGSVAYAMAYINEKKANGSIFPSWIIHGCSNIFASVVALFSII